MASSLLDVLVTLGAVLSFVMTGIYFAFSNFIMRSLNAVGYQEAISAMNSINREIVRPGFMLLFFGSSFTALLVLILILFFDSAPFSGVLIIGSLLYLIGMFGCTAVFNVPLNNRLMAAVGSGKDLEREWSYYLKKWTRWNHIRTICCAMSGLIYLCSHLL